MNQSSYNFEWIIIDDGSTDNTFNFVESIIPTSPFNIKISKQKNSGKPSALNFGYSLCNSNWVFIVDSDDLLIKNAVEEIINDLVTYSNKNAVAYRRRFVNGQIIGAHPIKFNTMVSNPTFATKLFKGDLAFVIRKEILLKFKFPIYPMEKFIPEQYIWNKISDISGILYFCNKSIYITEYLDDGYSRNFQINLKNNPRGFLLFYKDQFLRSTSVFDFIKYLLRIIQCYCYIFKK